MKPQFTPWYRGARADLVAAIARAVADDDVASDAVDEALLRAFERWDTVAIGSSPTGWVTRSPWFGREGNDLVGI